MSAILSIIIAAVALAILFRFAPRPRLDPTPSHSRVPEGLNGLDLADWLKQQENAEGNVTEGAEAEILWAEQPGETELCILYVHGFSATRQEIAPVCEDLAAAFNANVVYARLAGHGLEKDGMQASAEQWLESMIDIWDVASRVGQKVVVVACSTGAPLSLWLKHQLSAGKLTGVDQIHSLIFCSPNIKIKSPFSFLLTWPWAKHWVPLLLGKTHEWEPENELTSKYWTWRYSTLAIIEMQKVVDWVRRTSIASNDVPLATIYMEGDPTIDHDAAISFHESWQAGTKALHRVDIDADNPQHVFAGAIAGPHRTAWCSETCINFVHLVNKANQS